MQKEKRKKTDKAGFSLAPYVIALALIVLLRIFVFTGIRVDGHSMEDTLQNGETILLEKLGYVFSDPKRYDIVVCRFANREANYVKRIIAMPGETIEIIDQEIYIDGELLEGDIHAKGKPPVSHNGFRMTVPVRHYFVMGDNRADSMDSVELGAVRKDDIQGRGFAVVWPLSEIHLLT